MDKSTIVSLAAISVTLITGLAALWLTNRTERTKAKAQDNEFRLEEFNSLLSAYRDELDRKDATIARVRAERDAADAKYETEHKARAIAERRVETWLEEREK